VREYLKRAFLYRWNVLLFIGGVGAAVLSPWPDALLPLVAALEVAYLGGLVASPKFRSAVDAQVYQASRQESQARVTGHRSIGEVVRGLPQEAQRRFEQLRARCLEMRVIANQVRGRAGPGEPVQEDLGTAALDRLLWVFLRLLISQEALSRFLARTDASEIRARLAEAKSQLEASAGSEERIVRSLQDSVAAHQLRLENYDRAKRNAEFVRLELDRIEAKIHALTESAVNRQDPDFLSSQIDSVTESMQSTEKTISELQQITGLVDELAEPPAILEADLGSTRA
jgi:phage terminase Nu1 subunit (DNA packaging protein)